MFAVPITGGVVCAHFGLAAGRAAVPIADHVAQPVGLAQPGGGAERRAASAQAAAAAGAPA
jgi:hypothetical protein